MKQLKYNTLILFILLSASANLLSGANVFITTMDLTSRININAEIETRGLIDISYDGGYKYQGKLLFQYYNPDIENTQGNIVFDGAQASVLDIFNVIDLTYWTGYYGILGEGKHYKGHLYHREPGFDYNGYLPIVGTGIILASHHYDQLGGQIYTYQRYGSGNINSMDFTFWLDSDMISFSVFTGFSSSQYRIGGQFSYLGEGTQLYLTIGYPTLERGRALDLDEIYFLLEEWFIMKNWNLILSIFTRPGEHYNYEHRAYVNTHETNDIDFNFDLNYEPEASYFSGGTELNIQTNRLETFCIAVSPYVSIFTSGVTWKVKVDFNFLADSREFITAYLNIKASF